MPKQDEQQVLPTTLLAIFRAADTAEPEEEKKLTYLVESGLQELNRAVKETGQDGTLTLTIKVEPGAEARLNVQPKVKLSAPRPCIPGVTLYTDATGRLSAIQQGLFSGATTRSTQEN